MYMVEIVMPVAQFRMTQVKELELKVKELEPKVCVSPPDHDELVKCRAQV
jgi:hypothetical protein